MISVHLPKTAGTGFLHYLETQFHATSYPVQVDYGDRPVHASRWYRRYRAWRSCSALLTHTGFGGAIHGHFLPYKYRKAHEQGIPFVTWLREPVERLRSHYYYWLRSHDGTAGPLHERMVREGWDFERFALGPELRNLYTEFLWRFPLTNFAFVGITEHYDEDLESLSELLGFPGYKTDGANMINRRTDLVPEIEPVLREKIGQWHAKDVAMYEQALIWREAGRWAP